ncbi:MAG: hypothetical protein RLZZ93_870 [Actinomycetota bacterium]
MSPVSSCSMRLRTMNSFRSRPIPVAPAGSSTKYVRNAGITSRADLPRQSGFTGTSRHPRGRRPSSRVMRSTVSTAVAMRAGSAGRKAMPAAYAPAGGRSNPAVARMNASGTWMRIPAPSPVSASAPVAPRCSMLVRAVRPSVTISLLFAPFTFATKDTPQASCSKRGSYRPWGAGRSGFMVRLVLGNRGGPRGKLPLCFPGRRWPEQGFRLTAQVRCWQQNYPFTDAVSAAGPGPLRHATPL